MIEIHGESGKHLTLPADKDTVREFFASEPGRYTAEIVTHVMALDNRYRVENIDELNYLAVLLSEMSEESLEKLGAIAEFEDSGKIKDLINNALNLDAYEYISGILDVQALGKYLLKDGIPDDLKNRFRYASFDYAAYGQDAVNSVNGYFSGDGYIVQKDDPIAYYDGLNVPDDYRIFCITEKPSIRETVNTAKKSMEKSVAADNGRSKSHDAQR